jgi:hypothetical protein
MAVVILKHIAKTGVKIPGVSSSPASPISAVPYNDPAKSGSATGRASPAEQARFDLRLLDCIQSSHSGRVDRHPIHVKHRTMTRAVPAGLEVVPVEMAADMATSGGIKMQRTLVVAIRREFFNSAPNDRAFSAPELVQ